LNWGGDTNQKVSRKGTDRVPGKKKCVETKKRKQKKKKKHNKKQKQQGSTIP